MVIIVQEREFNMEKINPVVEILMKRDKMSRLEAENYVEEVREMLHEAAARGSYMECEDIMYDELGLEPDYLMDLLF